jgi:PAS domain S-box-containing protein
MPESTGLSVEQRLAEAEETLAALRRQEVDAVVGVDSIMVLRLREAEAKLQESEQRFRTVADRLPLMVWVNDAEGAQEFVNETFCEFFGVTREDMHADRWRTLMHPDDGDYVAEFVACVREQRNFHAEGRVRRADGEWRWLESWGRVHFAPDGKFLGHVGTSADITERKRAEIEIRALLQRLSTLVEKTPLAVVEWDADFAITRWSGQAERIFGWSVSDVIGKRIYDLPLVYEDDKPKVDAVMGQLKDPRNPFVISHNRNNTAAGAVITCEWYNSILRDNEGRMIAVLSLVLDVTERDRALESLREADHRKNDFLAVLAHELRNPLAPIRNGVEVLRRTHGETAVAGQIHSMIERQTAHLVRLIDDLMDISRITKGSFELVRGRVDMAEIVRNAVETSRSVIDERPHALTVSFAEAPLCVDGDAVRLTQAVTNLLVNAARYTPAGGHLRVTASSENGYAVVTVNDDGVGIASDMLQAIFDPFTRGGAASQSPGGLGIGLSLARSIVRMHGGEMEAQSAGLGCGSTFVMRIPLAGSEAFGAPPLEAAPLRSARRLRVLIVDDDRYVAASTEAVLQLMGHETSIAHDAATALAATMIPDVVLMDIAMPTMDGYAVAQALRARPAFARIPIIAMSGYGQPGDRLKSANAGFAAHLVKPVEPTVLERTINSLATPAD